MTDSRFDSVRKRLLEEIVREAAETAVWTGRAAFSERVMRAMATVPRHAFVSGRDQGAAYDNRPLGIGSGQTISQPYIVALMSDLLDLTESDRVLEIGTGSGYQTAVLARLAAVVFSVEVLPELAEAADRRLQRLGYKNVSLRIGDGFRGWPEQAPFDAIIVTAAPIEIPGALVDQTRSGGRLVLPVGPRGETQMLYRCVKNADGSLCVERKLPVAFVPMVPTKDPDRLHN